jgi:hypothetical protein
MSTSLMSITGIEMGAVRPRRKFSSYETYSYLRFGIRDLAAVGPAPSLSAPMRNRYDQATTPRSQTLLLPLACIIYIPSAVVPPTQANVRNIIGSNEVPGLVNSVSHMFIRESTFLFRHLHWT